MGTAIVVLIGLAFIGSFFDKKKPDNSVDTNPATTTTAERAVPKAVPIASAAPVPKAVPIDSDVSAKPSQVNPPSYNEFTLESTDGRTIRASILTVANGAVFVRREDGQQFEIPFDKLSQETIKQINEHRAKKMEPAKKSESR